MSANNNVLQIIISTSSGSVVIQEQYNDLKLKLDISHLNNGVYFIKVVSENGENTIEKLIKH